MGGPRLFFKPEDGFSSKPDRTITWALDKTTKPQGGIRAMNPLNSVAGAITSGFIAAVLVIIIVVALGGSPGSFYELELARWLHIISGITWIGLLYYFNLVQTPGLAAAAADKGGPGGAGVAKSVSYTHLRAHE